MTPTPPLPVLDGHNDTLTRIRGAGGYEPRAFLTRSAGGHVDLPRAREGGLAAGFFAIFTESPAYERVERPLIGEDGRPVPGGRSVPLPPRLDRRRALRYTLQVMADLFRMETEADGALRVVRTVAELRQALADGSLGVILHIEGAEAIDTGLDTLEVLYRAGLRSLGPVWSRSNAFGHGVPFDFPRSPDTGPGLTAAGRRLVRACDRLGIVIDLSHLNERGFRDVARLSHAPLVATHSAVHALCPSPRNLTDEQLDMIGASGGIVGINYHKGFLDPRGDSDAPVGVDAVARHARYVADRIGVEHVGLGSDFDGAVMPDDLPDVAALPRVLRALRNAGFSETDLRAVALGNWLRVLEEVWGS